jgi:hypothetical protein
LELLLQLFSSVDSKSARVRLVFLRGSAAGFATCDRVCGLLAIGLFCERGKSGMRCGCSLGLGVADFSFLTREPVESLSWNGDAGRLPRMACRARQLESAPKAPGLEGGGVDEERGL